MLDTIFARLAALFTAPDQPATALHCLDVASYADWYSTQPLAIQQQLKAARVNGKAGELALLSTEAANPAEAQRLLLLIDSQQPPLVWLDPLTQLAGLPEVLRSSEPLPEAALLGYGLSAYHFSLGRESKRQAPCLAVSSWPRAALEAQWLAMELINSPASALGPAEFAAIAQSLAQRHGGRVEHITGAELAKGYPAIHAVGRGAEAGREPRLLRLSFGESNGEGNGKDKVETALVGKGVTFDTGGLNLKPDRAMRYMKKDMGGAAHALALAHWLATDNPAARFDVWLPLVENAIGSAAFRPGDILNTRAGLRVEVGHTDAEGRLILADALTRASEEKPELILDFATLTGAARVALGPYIAPFFSNSDALATALDAAGRATHDPLWRLPLVEPYRAWIKPSVADLTNAPDRPYAGAITAALFLQAFVPETVAWAHLDIFAWSPERGAARPAGGAAQALRAVHHMLKERSWNRS